MRSEQTRDMTLEELKEYQDKISRMTDEELEEWRKGFDPDEMGFDGEEADDEYYEAADQV